MPNWWESELDGILNRARTIQGEGQTPQPTPQAPGNDRPWWEKGLLGEIGGAVNSVFAPQPSAPNQPAVQPPAFPMQFNPDSVEPVTEGPITGLVADWWRANVEEPTKNIPPWLQGPAMVGQAALAGMQTIDETAEGVLGSAAAMKQAARENLLHGGQNNVLDVGKAAMKAGPGIYYSGFGDLGGIVGGALAAAPKFVESSGLTGMPDPQRAKAAEQAVATLAGSMASGGEVAKAKPFETATKRILAGEDPTTVRETTPKDLTAEAIGQGLLSPLNIPGLDPIENVIKAATVAKVTKATDLAQGITRTADGYVGDVDQIIDTSMSRLKAARPAHFLDQVNPAQLFAPTARSRQMELIEKSQNVFGNLAGNVKDTVRAIAADPNAAQFTDSPLISNFRDALAAGKTADEIEAELVPRVLHDFVVNPVRVANELHLGPNALSDDALQSVAMVRAMVTDEAGRVMPDRLVNRMAEQVEAFKGDPQAIADAQLQVMFEEMGDAAKKLIPEAEAPGVIAKAGQLEEGVNAFFNAMYLGLSPSYAIRNVLNNVITGVLDVGPGMLFTDAAKTLAGAYPSGHVPKGWQRAFGPGEMTPKLKAATEKKLLQARDALKQAKAAGNAARIRKAEKNVAGLARKVERGGNWNLPGTALGQKGESAIGQKIAATKYNQDIPTRLKEQVQIPAEVMAIVPPEHQNYLRAVAATTQDQGNVMRAAARIVGGNVPNIPDPEALANIARIDPKWAQLVNEGKAEAALRLAEAKSTQAARHAADATLAELAPEVTDTVTQLREVVQAGDIDQAALSAFEKKVLANQDRVMTARRAGGGKATTDIMLDALDQSDQMDRAAFAESRTFRAETWQQYRAMQDAGAPAAQKRALWDNYHAVQDTRFTELADRKVEMWTNLGGAQRPPSQPLTPAPSPAPISPSVGPGAAPPPAAPAEQAASIPVMITRDMRQQLADLGYTRRQVDAMRPADAWETIKQQAMAQPVPNAPKPPAPAPAAATAPDAFADLGTKYRPAGLTNGKAKANAWKSRVGGEFPRTAEQWRAVEPGKMQYWSDYLDARAANGRKTPKGYAKYEAPKVEAAPIAEAAKVEPPSVEPLKAERAERPPEPKGPDYWKLPEREQIAKANEVSIVWRPVSGKRPWRITADWEMVRNPKTGEAYQFESVEQARRRLTKWGGKETYGAPATEAPKPKAEAAIPKASTVTQEATQAVSGPERWVQDAVYHSEWKLRRDDYIRQNLTRQMERIAPEEVTYQAKKPFKEARNSIASEGRQSGIQAKKKLLDELDKPPEMRDEIAAIDLRKYEQSHRTIVEQAIADGKPVPPEVMAEYPDLAAKVAPDPQAAIKAKLAAMQPDTAAQQTTRAAEEAAVQQGTPSDLQRQAVDQMGREVAAKEAGQTGMPQGTPEEALESYIATMVHEKDKKWARAYFEGRVTVPKSDRSKQTRATIIDTLTGRNKPGAAPAMSPESVRANFPDQGGRLYDVDPTTGERRAVRRMQDAPGNNPVTDLARANVDAYGQAVDSLRQIVAAQGMRPTTTGMTPQARKTFQQWVKQQWLPGVDRAREMASQTATRARDFALLNYADRRNIDVLVHHFFPFAYWQNHSIPNWMQRIAQHPNMASNALRFKRMMEEQNKDRPEWYRMNVDVGPLVGIDDPMYINILQSLMPLYNLVGNDFNDPDKKSLAGRLMQGANNLGYAPATIATWALSFGLYAQGEKDEARANMGYLSSASKAIKGATALAGVNGGQGLTIEPWLWDWAKGKIGQGFDKWDQNRIGPTLSAMQQRDAITPEQATEAGYTREGEKWDQAAQEVMQGPPGEPWGGRGLPAVIGWALGAGFKTRSKADEALAAANTEWRELGAKSDDMTDAERTAAYKSFYQTYPFYDEYRLTQKSNEADSQLAYTKLILGRLPPGAKKYAELAAVGITEEMYRKYSESKDTSAKVPYVEGQARPDPLATFSAPERKRWMAGVEMLASKTPEPTTAERAEWDSAFAAKDAMLKQAKAQFGNDIEAKEDAYFNLDTAARKVYRAQHPELPEFWEMKRQFKAQNPVIDKVFGASTGTGSSGPVNKDQWVNDARTIARERFGEDIWDLNDRYMDLPKGSYERRLLLAKEPRLKEFWTFLDVIKGNPVEVYQAGGPRFGGSGGGSSAGGPPRVREVGGKANRKSYGDGGSSRYAGKQQSAGLPWWMQGIRWNFGSTRSRG